jgi:hypothetical protein
MNQYPYHSNSLVAPALLVLIVVCIAGAVLANSDILNPASSGENPASTAVFRQITQTALANKSAQEAGIARQTQIAQQLTALPPEMTLQAAVAAPTMTAAAELRAAQRETATGIVILALAIVLPTAAIALMAAALAFFARRNATRYQEAKAREREAEAAILQAHDRWKSERNLQRPKVTPANHPPVSDGGHKTNLNSDTRNMWPDEEETKGKHNLPWVE